MYPPDFRYTKEHEWIQVKDKVGRIGITDYAQKELGDIVFVELPKVGTHLAAHESLGTVESVKAVSEIYSPVTGEVTEVNERLSSEPELLNKEPHGEAWIVKVRLEKEAELEELLSAEKYEDYIREESAG